MLADLRTKGSRGRRDWTTEGSIEKSIDLGRGVKSAERGRWVELRPIAFRLMERVGVLGLLVLETEYGVQRGG